MSESCLARWMVHSHRALIETSCRDLTLVEAENSDSANKYCIWAQNTYYICQQLVLYQT